MWLWMFGWFVIGVIVVVMGIMIMLVVNVVFVVNF